MSFACYLYALIFYLYLLICHPYVSRMYSYVIRMSLVYTRMSSVCHSYVLEHHPYVTRTYSHVIRMSLVCTRMSFACHSYVVLPWTLIQTKVHFTFCYSIRIKVTHKPSKVAPAKKTILQCVRYRCNVLHLLISLKQVFWKKSAFYVFYLHSAVLTTVKC